jgi:hypothetical protein
MREATMNRTDAELLDRIQRAERFLHEHRERLREVVTITAAAQVANARSWMVTAAAERDRLALREAARVGRLAVKVVGVLMQATLSPGDPLLAEWRRVITRLPAPAVPAGRVGDSHPLATSTGARHDWLGPARRCAARVLRRRRRVPMRLIESARTILSKIPALFGRRGAQPRQSPDNPKRSRTRRSAPHATRRAARQ